MRIKTEQAFRDFISDLLRETKEDLQANGFVPLAAIIVPAKGDLRNVDLQKHMNEAEELHGEGRHEEAVQMKKDLGLALRELLHDVKAIGYVTAGKASVSVPKPEDTQIIHGEEPGKGIVRGTLPRFDPQRRDALVLNWEWKGKEGPYKAGTIVQFFRREPGRIILEEAKSTEGEPTIGLLTGLLAK